MNYEQALDYISGYTDYEKVPLPHALGSYDAFRLISARLAGRSLSVSRPGSSPRSRG
jgi:hypothetical protein